MSGYNGWSNYPTWAVNLWLSNDEGLYNAAHELVGETLVDNGAEGARACVSDALKTWVREDLAPDSERASLRTCSATRSIKSTGTSSRRRGSRKRRSQHATPDG